MGPGDVTLIGGGGGPAAPTAGRPSTGTPAPPLDPVSEAPAADGDGGEAGRAAPVVFPPPDPGNEPPDDGAAGCANRPTAPFAVPPPDPVREPAPGAADGDGEVVLATAPAVPEFVLAAAGGELAARPDWAAFPGAAVDDDPDDAGSLPVCMLLAAAGGCPPGSLDLDAAPSGDACSDGAFWPSKLSSAFAGGFHVPNARTWPAAALTSLTLVACTASNKLLIAWLRSSSSKLESLSSDLISCNAFSAVSVIFVFACSTNPAEVPYQVMALTRSFCSPVN